MKTTVDYDTSSPQKVADAKKQAIADIEDYLGKPNFESKGEILGRTPLFEQFNFYCSMMGISGFPVIAWYDWLQGAEIGPAGVRPTFDFEAGIVDNIKAQLDYELLIRFEEKPQAQGSAMRQIFGAQNLKSGPNIYLIPRWWDYFEFIPESDVHGVIKGLTRQKPAQIKENLLKLQNL